MRVETTIRKFLLLVILALSLTTAPAMFAEQRSVENAVADSSQEERQAASAPCINYIEYKGGNADNFNFAAPFEPVQLSPALQAFLSPKQSRQFDEGGVDKPFAHSFFIKCCKVCRAELEIQVREEAKGPNSGDNDSITIGQAPFTVNTQKRILSEYLWPNAPGPRPPWASGNSSPKLMTIPLPAAALNNYIFNSDGCRVPIDIYVQDDTAVDYIKLKVWTY